MFDERYTIAIVVGTVIGLISRISMLRTDYRQYPTYPHGKIIHLSLGVIAAALGAVAVPSLFERDYTAVTFLALAAQQFRDVRNMERETLTKLDSMELVQRGATYIEGIAMVFEGRNYLAIFTAFTSSLFTVLFAWYWGVAAGAAALLIANYFKSGKSIQEIADVEAAPIRFEGPNVFVGDIHIMNVGLEESRKLIQEQALGLIFNPKNENCRVTLSNLGQRQAILYDLCTILGVVRDTGEPSLIPLTKLDLRDGRLGVFLLPRKNNPKHAVKTALQVPVLESAVRMPSEA
ncbi:YIEGIA family protein [Paenibacillus turpanensis]|uniref:YIEGIA family protein n=1 Tax=Paenibacillus turpanensis TaxID=2689078 RepID=UPI001FB7FBC5|nr:YIEGIA family protein [Paenibacillus turpanensis]